MSAPSPRLVPHRVTLADLPLETLQALMGSLNRLPWTKKTQRHRALVAQELHRRGLGNIQTSPAPTVKKGRSL